MSAYFGLAEGEEAHRIWHGEYDWRLLGKGTSFWGGQFALESLVLTLTDRNRLILINQSRNEEPHIWLKGELREIRLAKSSEGELMGPEGKMEPAQIVEVETAIGEKLRIRIPESAVQTLQDFVM
jgi:hypothetical protein